jgi:hypothetical protein
MGYLKTLTSKDVIVTPFTVHKQFSYSGQVPTYNNGIFNVLGTNNPYPVSGGSNGTGSVELVYNFIKQLYYSNYLEDGLNGRVSNATTASFNPDGTITGPFYTPNYINNIQSIDELRYFPTESGESILTLSIPSKLFGDYVKPGSFSASLFEGSPIIAYKDVYDDGQGNIIDTNDIKIGNILYSSGLIIITNSGSADSNPQEFSQVRWESSYTIYETQYKCTIRANEFNYSLNPSLLSGSIIGQNNILNSGSATYEDFVTGSDFSPYVTTVGLYSDNQELLAVAKLAQPLPTSQTTDTTILINLDR